MRNLLLIACLAASSVFFYACNTGTDSCENVVCLNGGTCNDGACDCPAGFTGTFCETAVGSGNVTINSTIQFSGTIDGVPVNYVIGQNGFQPYTSSSGSWGTNGELSQRQYFGGVIDFTTNRSAAIGKGNLQVVGNSVSLSEFTSFWTGGSFGYTPNAVNGVEVKWNDGTTQWSSGLGTGLQTAQSTFVITDDTTAPGWTGDILKVRVEVTCVLYDDNGNTKDLDGVFVVTIDHTL